jgi:hypothetical protein
MSGHPWRYWGKGEPDHGPPSITGALAISFAALLVTYIAVALVANPTANNVPGDILLMIIFVALAAWVDLRAFLTWRRIFAVRRGQQSGPG